MEELELARKYFPNLIKDTQDSKGIDSLIKDLQILDENLSSLDLKLWARISIFFIKTIKINSKKTDVVITEILSQRSDDASWVKF